MVSMLSIEDAKARSGQVSLPDAMQSFEDVLIRLLIDCISGSCDEPIA